MRKLIAFFILSASVLILVTAMNQGLINRVKQDRYFKHLQPQKFAGKSWYNRFIRRSDRWDYGDLYGICYLPGFHLKLHPFPALDNHQPGVNRTLYIIGDSFTADKDLGKAFAGFDKVVFLDRRFPFGPVTPDTASVNYLVMEFSELNLSTYSAGKSTEIRKSTLPQAQPAVNLYDRLGNIIFNKELNRNIELLLFDDKAFTQLKELKAELNYRFLGRLPKEVAMSSAGDRLLLNSTIDTASTSSVFRTWSNKQVSKIVNDLNTDQQRYLSMGFKKVYLTLIPNAVSLYDRKRGRYNHLLEKVEEKTKIPLISVYHPFESEQSNLYSRSDAHWNALGYSLWVYQMNRILGNDLR